MEENITLLTSTTEIKEESRLEIHLNSTTSFGVTFDPETNEVEFDVDSFYFSGALTKEDLDYVIGELTMISDLMEKNQLKEK